MKISNKVGSPVTGADFFGREDEQSQMWEALGQDDVLLLAPRRVGKTSLMYRLRDTAQDMEVAYLEVGGAADEVDFVRRLYASVAKLGSAPGVLDRLASGPVGRVLKRVKKASLLGKLVNFELEDGDPWADLGAALVEALDTHQGRRLILVDELPIFVLTLLRKDDYGERARRFLSWFRGLRQHPDRNGRLHWLLAGSIGLDTVTARLRLGDTINDLYVAHLGPFERETARRFLRAMGSAYDFPIPEDVLEHGLDRIGWLIPYHLQLLFRELRTECRRRKKAADVGAVDSVFDMLVESKNGSLDYWRQRLDKELGQPDASQALLLLNAVAQDPAGAPRVVLGQLFAKKFRELATRDEQLRYLLDVLESDGYLVRNEQRYRFRSPLLREFWVRKVA